MPTSYLCINIQEPHPITYHWEPRHLNKELVHYEVILNIRSGWQKWCYSEAVLERIAFVFGNETPGGMDGSMHG